MANGASAGDEDNVQLPKAGWSRDSIKKFIDRHYHVRVHMSLILAACGLTAMSVSWSLLHLGVHSMLVRYPAAISLAYGVFLIGVWTWLRATGLAGASESAADAPAGARKAKSGKGGWLDFSTGGGSSSGGGGSAGGGAVRGGGGSFDGGGASSSFASTRGPLVAAAAVPQSDARASSASSSTTTSSSSSHGGSGGGFDLGGIDGDGIVLLVLAVLLIGVVLITSGYLIWCAPDVLTEAAFGAGLSGALARPTANHAEGGWVAGVVKKTWWPFALVLVAAMAFAGWSQAHYPQAATFKQAIAIAIHGN
jgi:hypothetical protein